jgi:S-adenosyl-L-methionine hydrolase (adenosine-forming)
VALITLLTDFGLEDTYVGQMKGAILATAPATSLVDLTHAVPPQDLQAGAFLLWSAVETFAAGTIHLAVVDPGVGSPRRGLAIRCTRGDTFVGPDNGLLAPAVERLGGALTAVSLADERFWRTTVAAPSATFNGRDIFGPVAGHLANGVPLEDLGPVVTDFEHFALPRASGRTGEVIHIDRFGNLVTNLPATSLPKQRFQARVGDKLVPCLGYYAAAPPSGLLALVGSAGLLEICARDASAAKLTGVRRGAPVTLEFV